MTCKGTCTKYKAGKPHLPDTRYGNGQKRCNSCNLFINWGGKHCPCCGTHLRTKPRSGKARNNLMVVQQVKRI